MTREEAIKNLKFVRGVLNDDSRIAQSYDMAIASLSAEGEYIKKEEFKSAIHNYFIGLNHNVTEEDIQAYIDALALYSFPDREKGEWEYTGDYLTEGMLKCSKCGKEVDVSEWDFHFCPNCGRIMRGDKAE